MFLPSVELVDAADLKVKFFDSPEVQVVRIVQYTHLVQDMEAVSPDSFQYD